MILNTTMYSICIYNLLLSIMKAEVNDPENEFGSEYGSEEGHDQSQSNNDDGTN